MTKQTVFTMRIEPELRDAFMAEAQAAHRPASQVARELMREFVERQREAREYDEFLRRKVDTARAVRGLTELEPDRERQLKYVDFIDIYSALNNNEMADYEKRYPQETKTMAGLRERLLISQRFY